MDSIIFRGGVATVKLLRIHTIALTVEYFCTHGFYEWLAIFTGSYWSSEELKTLLGDLDRNECKPSQAHLQVVSEKVIYCCTSLTSTSTNVHDFEPLSMHAAINPSQLWHVFSISLAQSMHMHATTRANNHVGR